MYDSSKCITNKQSKETCFSERSLTILSDVLQKQGYKINKKKPIYPQIKRIMKQVGTCQDEKCWLTMNLIVDKLTKRDITRLKADFKPDMPESWKQDKETWLTTVDINSVLKRYMENDPTHFTYGALPIDSYDQEICVNDLCKFDLQSHMNQGIQKITLVYNTDEYGESGQHWICLYIDIRGKNLKTPCIYFFDSYGTEPPERVNQFVSEVIRQGSEINIPFLYTYNDKQHQSSGGECGVYCLHFLTYMLQGGSFNSYIHKKKDEAYMNKFRFFFYD